MSAPGKFEKTAFLGFRKVPWRPAEVSHEEYEQLLAGLDTTVLGALSEVASKLRDSGFTIVKLERRAGLASLVVKSGSVSAWIYFQIYRTLPPLLSNDRVSWLYAVGEALHSTDGKPSRLQDLSDGAAIREIVARFTALCLAAKDKA